MIAGRNKGSLSVCVTRTRFQKHRLDRAKEEVSLLPIYVIVDRGIRNEETGAEQPPRFVPTIIFAFPTARLDRNTYTGRCRKRIK